MSLQSLMSSLILVPMKSLIFKATFATAIVMTQKGDSSKLFFYVFAIVTEAYLCTIIFFVREVFCFTLSVFSSTLRLNSRK